MGGTLQEIPVTNISQEVFSPKYLTTDGPSKAFTIRIGLKYEPGGELELR